MRAPHIALPSRMELEEYAWSAGRGILVSQWFTNGSLGSSWLPGLAKLDSLMPTGQILVYAAYCMLLVVLGVVFYKQIEHKVRRPVLVLATSTAILTLGDLIAILVGLEAIDPAWYLPGMTLIGIGMVAPMVGWSKYCCAVGERKACIAVSLSLATGALLFAAIAAIGSFSPVFGAIVQVGLIPFSAVCLVKACGYVNLEQARTTLETPRLSLRPILPYLVTVLLFGLVFGIIVGINNNQQVESPTLTWVIGTVAMGVPALLGAHFARSFNLGVLARMLLPVFLLCIYLFPFAMNRIPALVSILGCASYTFSLIFYQTAFAAIAQTRKVPVLPLVSLAICADSAGIIVGEYMCGLLGATESMSSSAVYTITFSVVILAILAGFLFLGDHSTASVWGLKPEPSEYEKAEQRCLKVAARHGLTLRETQMLCMLATGLDPIDAARELGISASTARTHARNIYAKLELHSQPDLIRYVLFDALPSEAIDA